MCRLEASAATPRLPRTLPFDKPWQKPVYEFTRDHLQHSAWGLGHSERDFLLSREISEQAGLQADPDVLFAAAMLHDMGGFAPYQQEGVDHALRSAQVCDQVLRPAGFPEEKIEAVKTAISTHSYYSTEKPQTPEAVALHDADTLDFLGAIGVARIVSLTGHEAPTLEASLKLAERLLHDAPPALITPYAQAQGAVRAAEMEAFFAQVGGESFNRAHL